MGIILLKLVLTAIPCAALCACVFINDINCKKLTAPILLLLLGALVTLPAGAAERLLAHFIFTAPADNLSVPAVFGNRLVLAFVEESAKWIILLIYTTKKRAIHGVSCAFFITAGFAVAENFIYYQYQGPTSLIIRSTTAAVAHCFCGIISGYFSEVCGIYKAGYSFEKQLCANGVISECRLRRNAVIQLILSITIPVVLHAVYNFMCTFSSATATSLCIVYCAGLYLLSFHGVSYCRKNLRNIEKTAVSEVCKKHPADAPEIIRRMSEKKSLNQPIFTYS